MDARRVLAFLLLVFCTINGAFANQNGWGRPNNIRRVRRISEYLVPPPLPRFHPSGRVPRLANYQSTPPQQGYLGWLMNMLNFGSDSSSQPPPPPQSEVPKYFQSDPLPAATTYNGPPPVDYVKPPFPPSSINGHSGYPAPIKPKICNSCNKVPWLPIQNDDHALSGDPPPLEQPVGEYLPGNRDVSHDTYHAASQEIRAPDFPFPYSGQDDSFIGPQVFPTPHLFPGAMPPLFKAGDFHYPVQTTSVENSGYLEPPSLSVPGNGALTGNGSFLDVAGHFNGEHNGQSVYPGPSGVGIVPQEVGYNNPGGSNGEYDNFHQPHGDLSSSGTQVSHGHANLIPDKQRVEGTNKGLFNSENHQTSPSGPGVLDRQPSGVSNNGDLYDVTGSSGSPGNFLDSASQTDPNFPSSYGTSDLDRVPNNYEHNGAQGSRAPFHTSVGSSGTIGDSINFEESPLLDFTHKGESRTPSSPIPSTSNAFAGFVNTEIAETTAVPGDEIFGTHEGIDSTTSYFPTDYFETTDTVAKESKINISVAQETKSIRQQNVSPSNSVQDLWSTIFPTTIGTDREPFGDYRNVLQKPYDDVAEETLNDDINVNLDETSGAKRSKQVQVIIPYTSQYTPLPFHPTLERNTGESNYDNYVGEESRNRVKVVSPPNSSHIFQSWPTTLAIFEGTTKKPVDTKANNSIDVHKLQKNIDNWTIQEYSKNLTSSTMSPSSGNPYLFPSKKIPDKYFTITETEHAADSDSKTFTFGGFSFDDEEYKGSTSNRMEKPREIKIEKSTEAPNTNAPIVLKDMWQSFPVGISSVSRERVYIVTPQPSVTSPRSNSEYRQEKTLNEVERSEKRSKKTDTKETKKSDTFESIEKAYQVLPQAVNNLAVASTGPESVPLWGIMEHEEFASPADSEYDNDTESPLPYSRLSKKLRARR